MLQPGKIHPGPAVQSVVSQDYAGEVEIIVVDDHSTDGSRSILQTLTQHRPGPPGKKMVAS